MVTGYTSNKTAITVSLNIQDDNQNRVRTFYPEFRAPEQHFSCYVGNIVINCPTFVLIIAQSFPPVRACLFDMDGLLINTEDLYTLSDNLALNKYGRPPLPWSIKAKLQGRPGPEANKIFLEWAKLPITQEQYQDEVSVLRRDIFPATKLLPGVPELLASLTSDL